jgi:hypothetical protein
MNSAFRASAAPTGAPFVSTTMPTSALGIIVKAVPAPKTKAPEWLSATRPPGWTPTLKPNP